jgi:ATP-dependent Lon protease
MTKKTQNNMSNHKIHTIDNLSLQEYDSEAELIPLLTPEDEEEMINEELPDSLLILPGTWYYFLVL